MRTFILLFAALLAAGCGEKSPVQQAVVIEASDGKETAYYRDSDLEPYDGWAKEVHERGKVKSLGRIKAGKRIGP